MHLLILKQHLFLDFRFFKTVLHKQTKNQHLFWILKNMFFAISKKGAEEEKKKVLFFVARVYALGKHVQKNALGCSGTWNVLAVESLRYYVGVEGLRQPAARGRALPQRAGRRVGSEQFCLGRAGSCRHGSARPALVWPVSCWIVMWAVACWGGCRTNRDFMSDSGHPGV